MRRSSSPRDGVIVLAIVAAVFALQWPLRLRSVSLIDEGAILQIAEEVREGRRLYADAVHYALPGVFWLLAAVFGIAGTSIAAARTLAIAIFAVASGLMYAIGRWSLSRLGALALVVLFVAYRMWAYPHWQMLSYSSLAVMLALAATAALGTALGQARRWPFALAGALAAATVLTKQDSGATSALALGLVTLLPPPVGAPSRGRIVAAFVGGGTLVAALAAAAVVRGGYASDLVRETFLAPLYGVRHFDYPGIPALLPLFRQDPTLRHDLFSYFPPILLDVSWITVANSRLWQATAVPDVVTKLAFHLPWIVLLAAVVSTARRRDEAALAHRRAWLVVALGAAFLVAFSPPRDWIHLFVLYPPTLLLGATLVGRATRGRRLVRALAYGAVGGAAAASVWLAVQLHQRVSLPVHGPRGTLFALPGQAEPLQAAIDALTAATPADAPLAALPYHPLLDFLTARRGLSRYYVVWPVDIDRTRDAQVIAALEAQPEAIVVYSPTIVPHFPPFRDYAPVLYDYLIDHYEIDGTLGAAPGGFSFMRLRRTAPPAGRSLLGAALAAARVVREPFDGAPEDAPPGERAALVEEARWPFAHVLAVGTLPDAAVSVAYRLTPAAGEHFRARAGVDPDAWTWFPVLPTTFTVAIRDADGERTSFTTTLDPPVVAADRRWQDVDVDLSAWAGRDVTLVLRVVGRKGAPAVAARGGFADPRISSE